MSQRPAPIFIITGTPGSGKSSVATALAQRFPCGMHIPMDDLREWVVSGIAHPVPIWTDETARQFALARHATAIVAKLYADNGFVVTIDDVIFPAEVKQIYEDALPGYLIYKVLLYPSLVTALTRNATRTNKDFDTAVLDDTIRRLHHSLGEQPFADYGWIILNTTCLGLDETVDEILKQTLEKAM